MVNGPWDFSGLAQAHILRQAVRDRPSPDPCGQAARHRALGGEDWMIGNRARSCLLAARAGLPGADARCHLAGTPGVDNPTERGGGRAWGGLTWAGPSGPAAGII
jgi:hypothetical protein